ncbi:MAG: hypothetical protein V7L04_21915 [Nostoc sp.]
MKFNPKLNCPMPNAQCPMPMPNAQCPMPNAQCPTPHSAKLSSILFKLGIHTRSVQW